MNDAVTAPTCEVDVGEVERFASVIFDPAHNVELRMIGGGPALSVVRRGSDLAGLVAAVRRNVRDHCYCVLNPVDKPVGTAAAGKEDVAFRRWLFVEADPKRPSGVAATDAEKEAARAVARAVYLWLRGRGWPEPVVMDSGNGTYLLYRIGLPNDPDPQPLLRDLLVSLSIRFSSDSAKIDTAVHDAPRLARVAGTWNRKGESTEDRPHRMARLLRVPDVVEVVSREQIEAAVEALPPPQADEVEPVRRSPSAGDGPRPGDEYNQRGEVAGVLVGAGWQLEGERNGRQCWTRPGKDPRDGLSATFGYCTSRSGGYPLFYVFSSNAPPFEPGRGYSPFAVYAMLRHNGDWSEAARELNREGYGSPPYARNGHHGPQEAAAAPRPQHAVGPLSLRPGAPRQTNSGKIAVPVAAFRDGTLVYPFQITSVDSSRRTPARRLAEMAGVPVEEADAALVRVLAAAAQRLSDGGAPSGPSLYEIVMRVLPPALQLTHRTDRGTLWSETYGREVGRQEWVAHVQTPLLNACSQAHDVPRDPVGKPVREDLIRLVQRELVVVWADLMATLPDAGDVDLTETTEAGGKFRRDLVALWTRPQTFEVRRGGDHSGEAVASRASLASRAHSLVRPYLQGALTAGARERWKPIHEAFAAWWRPYVSGDGEARCALAMRHELAAQISVSIDGVVSQASLRKLGVQFGCILSDALSDAAGLPSHASGGNRLAVLTPSVTDELLAEPIEPDDSDSSASQ